MQLHRASVCWVASALLLALLVCVATVPATVSAANHQLSTEQLMQLEALQLDTNQLGLENVADQELDAEQEQEVENELAELGFDDDTTSFIERRVRAAKRAVHRASRVVSKARRTVMKARKTAKKVKRVVRKVKKIELKSKVRTKGKAKGKSKAKKAKAKAKRAKAKAKRAHAKVAKAAAHLKAAKKKAKHLSKAKAAIRAKKLSPKAKAAREAALRRAQVQERMKKAVPTDVAAKLKLLKMQRQKKAEETKQKAEAAKQAAQAAKDEAKAKANNKLLKELKGTKHKVDYVALMKKDQKAAKLQKIADKSIEKERTKRAEKKLALERMKHATGTWHERRRENEAKAKQEAKEKEALEYASKTHEQRHAERVAKEEKYHAEQKAKEAKAKAEQKRLTEYLDTLRGDSKTRFVVEVVNAVMPPQRPKLRYEGSTVEIAKKRTELAAQGKPTFYPKTGDN